MEEAESQEAINISPNVELDVALGTESDADFMSIRVLLPRLSCGLRTHAKRMGKISG